MIEKKEISNSNNRNLNIDILRIVSAFAVVGIHVSTTLTDNHSINEIGRDNFLILTAMYSCFQWAVPVFLMISGSLLLHKDTSLHKVKKYVLRMVLVLLVFGIPFSLMMLVFNARSFYPSMLIESFLMVIQQQSWAHLWYLYMLIGIYLLLIPLRKIAVNLNNKEWNFLIVALLIGNFLIPEINNIFGTSISNFMVFTQYVTYFLIGYYLTNYECKDNACSSGIEDKYIKNKYPALYIWLRTANCNIFIGLFILASLIKIISQIIWLNSFGVESPLVKGDRMFTFVQAVSIFMCFMNHAKITKQSRIIKSISRCSFGIYIIHPFFIHILYKVLWITPVSILNVWIATPLLLLFVFSISWVCTSVMIRIPGIRNII